MDLVVVTLERVGSLTMYYMWRSERGTDLQAVTFSALESTAEVLQTSRLALAECAHKYIFSLIFRVASSELVLHIMSPSSFK